MNPYEVEEIKGKAAAEERERWAALCENTSPKERALAQASRERGDERMECFRLGSGNALAVMAKALRRDEPSLLEE